MTNTCRFCGGPLGTVFADLGLTPAEIAGGIGAALLRTGSPTGPGDTPSIPAPHTAGSSSHARKEQVSDDIV